MIRCRRLSDGLEFDIGGSLLVPHLAGLAYHHSTVDPPSLAVLFAILVGVELEDREASLFAIAGGQTKILDSGFIAAIGASIDPPAGEALGE